ncbi:uncharacterized protein K452DRAFT_47288 [Aplosporella prunicola CBS 121167]|uniref:Uncharacterized protein n=1 Tax=Aplosporella prunicola CBS 121167 TaxID=1176127 RepID=A0A6A6B937_9PEZI|nr:uncharacterized protein K452DRAFT_47288 [Aplosporella prunicola CBS 121167]KAF2140486.1 hypothetical protein K452DRAFT_47288 [Aplosporella prunicola CBS 121167]
MYVFFFGQMKGWMDGLTDVLYNYLLSTYLPTPFSLLKKFHQCKIKKETSVMYLSILRAHKPINAILPSSMPRQARLVLQPIRPHPATIELSARTSRPKPSHYVIAKNTNGRKSTEHHHHHHHHHHHQGQSQTQIFESFFQF